MSFKFKNNFSSVCILYITISLFLLLVLSFIWLPPGYTIAGHDSGLPLDTKQFLSTRLFAWDDRIGVGLDNSANFGSLTIHFFDYISSIIAGVPYGGSFVSMFFWMAVIFLSSFFLAYQLKDILGKPFIFILPIFLVFNFYIFQSVFMLERAKFGVFSASLIALAFIFKIQLQKSSVLSASIISALSFSVFNGGGWFGVTLYAGVGVLLLVIIFTSFFDGLLKRQFTNFKRILSFILLTTIFFLFLNAYSILPYAQNFLSSDAPRLLQESSMEGHKDWLRYVSRSTSFINLFRLVGIPDWYGEPNDFGKVNQFHPYAALYLNNNILVAISAIFPVLAFASLLLSKTKEQKKILSFFGILTLVELIFAAGSHSPFGTLYELLMTSIPGFFLLRSSFYKFGIFYMLGLLVMFSFTLSFFIDKLSQVISHKLIPNLQVKNFSTFFGILLILVFWFAYHWVLFDPTKIFAWKSDQSTRVQVPQYVFDFAKWVDENDLNKRILLVPPVNRDWQNDAYTWGYWSLSPLTYALTSARVLSNWHGLVGEQAELVDDIYNFIKTRDEKNFTETASNLDIGYILVREDVLLSSNWSSAEEPSSYKQAIESFKGARKITTFGEWSIYELDHTNPKQIFAINSVNLISDNFISLINNYFPESHAAGFSTIKSYPEINKVSANKAYPFDCLSCLLEKESVKNIPSTVIKPGSIFYYFKEKREQQILDSTTDTRSRIANYLGFTLNRGAELRQMVDSPISERILLESMGVIRAYLFEIHKEIESSKDYSTDFRLLRQVLDYLNPIDREIGNYMKGSASRMRSHRFGEEMLGILWDINRIKQLFNPLLENQNRWLSEKAYNISFDQSGEYVLTFSAEAFPHTLSNDVILPKVTKFTRNGVEKILEIKKDRVEWLTADLGFQEEGVGELRLYFEETPNLYDLKVSGNEQFFFGKVACYSNPIKNFNKGRAYQVMISKTERLRKLQVIFKDKNKVYTDRHGFLKGEDLFEVDSIPQGEFAKYVYFPTPQAKDIYMYICSDDAILPPVDRVYVKEFFIPSVVSIRKSSNVYQAPPDVEYHRIDPTQYKVKVVNQKEPFILMFNENFNSGWHLFSENGEELKVIDKHFAADGYANAWLVDEASTKEFVIKYMPQKMFYIGCIISAISLLLGIGLLVYRRFKYKTNL